MSSRASIVAFFKPCPTLEAFPLRGSKTPTLKLEAEEKISSLTCVVLLLFEKWPVEVTIGDRHDAIKATNAKK